MAILSTTLSPLSRTSLPTATPSRTLEAAPTPLAKDLQQLEKALATQGSIPRTCLRSLLEMFAWGAMFDLGEAMMQALLTILGHIVANLHHILGALF